MNRTQNQDPPSAKSGHILVETRDFRVFQFAAPVGLDLS
jgi:hypothetical protein